MSTLHRSNWWEVGAAAALFALGAYIAWSGWDYGLGQLRTIGPGFFPLVVGLILMGLSAGIVVSFRRSRKEAPNLPVRPIAAITAGLIAFGVLVSTAGFAIATFVLVFVSALGDRSVTPLRAAIVAVAVAILGYLVFIVAFRLPFNLFWW